MLYLGHFSFSQEMRQPGSRRVEPWHGYFTTVADAPDPETAIKKFQRLLRKLGVADMFQGVSEIYLDSCIEVRKVPARGFLAHFSAREGEDLGGIATSVLGAKASEATGFDLDPAPDEEVIECEPFVVLEQGPRLVRNDAAPRAARDKSRSPKRGPQDQPRS